MADLVERLNCDCDSDDCTFKLAKDRIEQLEAEIARKDEALCFYADPEAYCQLYIPGIPLTDPRSFAPVLQDDGKRARKALAALGSKT